jgi:hypothetical protein
LGSGCVAFNEDPGADEQFELIDEIEVSVDAEQACERAWNDLVRGQKLSTVGSRNARSEGAGPSRKSTFR